MSFCGLNWSIRSFKSLTYYNMYFSKKNTVYKLRFDIRYFIVCDKINKQRPQWMLKDIIYLPEHIGVTRSKLKRAIQGLDTGLVGATCT